MKKNIYVIYYLALVMMISLIIFLFINPDPVNRYAPYALMLSVLGMLFNLYLLKKKDKSKDE